ncbi:MAG: hypothetical protein ACKOE6_10935 [Flammeovirgaceae bacterium]
MAKVSAFLLLAGLLLASHEGFSQNADLSPVIKEVFFHKEVSEKIFLEPTEKGGNKIVYIMADTIFQRINPGILERLQRERGKVVLLDEKSTTVNVINDPWFYINTAPLFVLFKHWEATPKRIKVTIRTSSLYLRKQMKDRYIVVSCVLVKEKDAWHLKQTKIEKKDCCDNIFGEIEIHKD